MSNVKDFLKRKDIVITPQRYLIEALGAITPVPGGVGTVTTSVLVGHVVQAAAKKAGL